MDNHLEFLFAGFAVFWAGIFVYLLLLQLRVRALERELELLEERLSEAGAEPRGDQQSSELPAGES